MVKRRSDEPFIMVPHRFVWGGPLLTPAENYVYCALLTHNMKGFQGTGRVNPSIERMAMMTGMSYDRTKKAIDGLIEKGFLRILIEARGDKNGRTYELLVPEQIYPTDYLYESTARPVDRRERKRNMNPASLKNLKKGKTPEQIGDDISRKYRESGAITNRNNSGDDKAQKDLLHEGVTERHPSPENIGTWYPEKIGTGSPKKSGGNYEIKKIRQNRDSDKGKDAEGKDTQAPRQAQAKAKTEKSRHAGVKESQGLSLDIVWEVLAQRGFNLKILHDQVVEFIESICPQLEVPGDQRTWLVERIAEFDTGDPRLSERNLGALFYRLLREWKTETKQTEPHPTSLNAAKNPVQSNEVESDGASDQDTEIVTASEEGVNQQGKCEKDAVPELPGAQVVADGLKEEGLSYTSTQVVELVHEISRVYEIAAKEIHPSHMKGLGMGLKQLVRNRNKSFATQTLIDGLRESEPMSASKRPEAKRPIK